MDIKQKQFHKTLEFLTAIGCKFAVQHPDYGNHGELAVVEKKKYKHSGVKYRPYTTNHLKEMQIGDVIEVPYGEYECNGLQAALASEVVHLFGAHTCTTHMNHAKQVVEVLRYA